MFLMLEMVVKAANVAGVNKEEELPRHHYVSSP